AANTVDFAVLATAQGTIIRAPNFNTPPGSMLVEAGATGVVVEDAPSDFTYADVTDSTNGAQVDFRRSKPVVTTVAASGAAQTVGAPQLTDQTVVVLTAD